MGSLVRQLARRVRHLPGIENWHGLWDAARGPYQRLLNAKGGAEITVPGGVTIRIPAEFAGADWEDYEPEALSLVASWACGHRRGLFLDIGCAMGIYSAVALFAAADTEVLACDADLSSLAATRRFCQHARGLLRTVYGFVADTGSGAGLSLAEAQTAAAFRREQPSGDVGTTRYVCLEDPGVAEIPRNTLDDLFRAEPVEARPVLIKCDVEGAELLVLYGARQLLARCRPALLLSIHPPALPLHGHSKEDVSAFLRELDYQIAVVAVDHEEHWWCT